MIECIFTIDYEIYGNGKGSLKDHVYGPAELFSSIFRKYGKPFVLFLEAAELETIEKLGRDPEITAVKKQIRNFHIEGVELGLHIHPQWYNAKWKNGEWLLDYEEYNLCTLPESRIVEIVNRSIEYIKSASGCDNYSPLSFRAGNWLFQPTQPAARILATHGIKVDSSVFKGGIQRQHNMDYRRALQNGYYWNFTDDVQLQDSNGMMTEIPIYSKMVPFWKMLTTKRLGLHQISEPSLKSEYFKFVQFRDRLRIMYPLKLDFCRMTISELIRMIDTLIQDDEQNPDTIKPIVTIGHTKDIRDLNALELFLLYLEEKKINITTFMGIFQKMC